MKKDSILISSYAILLIIGGLIGYYTAGSLASIIMSGTFAAMLLVCAFLVNKGNKMAFDIVLGLVFCLFLFFGYRFFITFKIAPAGIMTLLSGAFWGLLVSRR